MPILRKYLSLAAFALGGSLLIVAVGWSATPQDLAGYTLQEILLVPVTGSSVSSQTTLLQGVHYKLRARGSATVNVPGIFGTTFPSGDAEYAFGRISWFLSTSIDRCNAPFPGTDIGIEHRPDEHHVALGHGHRLDRIVTRCRGKPRDEPIDRLADRIGQHPLFVPKRQDGRLLALAAVREVAVASDEPEEQPERFTALRAELPFRRLHP